MTNLNTTGNRSTVSFGNVEVREYERILNARADVSVGLALGWSYTPKASVPIGDYEFRRTQLSETEDRPESTSLTERFTILKNFGFDETELRQAEATRLDQQKPKSKGLVKSFMSGFRQGSKKSSTDRGDKFAKANLSIDGLPRRHSKVAPTR